jgi:hypothetical protein
MCKTGIEALPVIWFFVKGGLFFRKTFFHQTFQERKTHLYDTPNFDTFLNSVLTDTSMDSFAYRVAFGVDRFQHLMDAVAQVT